MALSTFANVDLTE